MRPTMPHCPQNSTDDSLWRDRLMRRAAVAAGAHRLVYWYAPRSFQVGRVVSMLGLAARALLGIACAVRPIGHDEGEDEDK
jgi:hypothetical protein